MDNLFLNIDDFSWSDIDFLFKHHIEESISLDYKSGKTFSNSNSEGIKKDISKDISAFANSDGGIIIYGIDEEKHKSSDYSFINGEEFTKEWLENVIDGNIHRRIANLRVFPIRKNKDITKSLYIIRIPSSNDAPHMCNDKRFYRRYNFKSVPMEEYEVRLLYFRKSKPEINIDFISMSIDRSSQYFDEELNRDIISTTLNFHIINISDSIEHNCKLEATFNKGNEYTSRFISDQPNTSYVRDPDNKVVLSGYNVSPIFPDETVSILSFDIEVFSDKLNAFLDETEIQVRYFDSTKTKSKSYKIKEFKNIKS